MIGLEFLWEDKDDIEWQFCTGAGLVSHKRWKLLFWNDQTSFEGRKWNNRGLDSFLVYGESKVRPLQDPANKLTKIVDPFTYVYSFSRTPKKYYRKYSVVYNLINKIKNNTIFHRHKYIFISRSLRSSIIISIHQQYILLIISIKFLNEPMSTAKPSTPSGRYSKLQNKLLNTSHTHRNSQYQADPIRKDSRTKVRKETTENSNVTSERQYGEYLRAPFTEIFEHSTKNSIKFSTGHKKETSTLDATNQQLQQKINSQAKEINQFRETLASIKQSLGNKECNNLGQGEQLRNANSQLQKKFEEQSAELHNLKKEISSVKEALEADKSQTMSIKSSAVADSKVSRRAEYTKAYEMHTAQAIKAHCSQCARHTQDMEELRSKYGDELRKMSEEITVLKEKEILLGVLELQIQNKNDCIDFLRSELETFEDNSKHLLAIVDTLEMRLAQSQQGRSHPPSFHVPSESYRNGRY